MAWAAPGGSSRRTRLDEAGAEHGIIQNDDFVHERLYEKLEVVRKAIGQRVRHGTLRSVFDSFDLDGNGTIDQFELKEALIKCGLLSVSKEDTIFFMDVMDENGDGVIQFEEFEHFFNTDVDQLKHKMNKRATFRIDTLASHRDFAPGASVSPSLSMGHEARPMASGYSKYSSGKTIQGGRRTSFAFGFSTRHTVLESESAARQKESRSQFRKQLKERIESSGGIRKFFKTLDPTGKNTKHGPEGPEIPIPAFKRGLDRLGLSFLYQSAKNVLEGIDTNGDGSLSIEEAEIFLAKDDSTEEQKGSQSLQPVHQILPESTLLRDSVASRRKVVGRKISVFPAHRGTINFQAANHAAVTDFEPVLPTKSPSSRLSERSMPSPPAKAHVPMRKPGVPRCENNRNAWRPSPLVGGTHWAPPPYRQMRTNPYEMQLKVLKRKKKKKKDRKGVPPADFDAFIRKVPPPERPRTKKHSRHGKTNLTKIRPRGTQQQHFLNNNRAPRVVAW